MENWFDGVDDPARDEGDTSPKPARVPYVLTGDFNDGLDSLAVRELQGSGSSRAPGPFAESPEESRTPPTDGALLQRYDYVLAREASAGTWRRPERP